MKSAMRRSMADIWSRSARIFSSGDMDKPPSADSADSADRLQPANLANPQPRRVGHGDLRLAEVHATIYRIERAKGRAVEVDLGDDARLGHRQVHSRGDADARLQHATDHALDLVHRADVGDADRVRQAGG